MNALIKKIFTAVALILTVAATPAQATVLGNLNDGLNHTSNITGYWSLFVNAGDNVTVTARRLSGFDPVAFAWNGPEGAGGMIGGGDDELGANCCGGGWGDPQFSFVAATSGEYSVGVFRFGSNNAIENLSYYVNQTGATGSAVPLPGTLVLLGLGLAALGVSRRKAA